VDIATGEAAETEIDTSGQHKGGLIGGKVRADNLTAKERSEIAKKAADAPWGKTN